MSDQIKRFLKLSLKDKLWVFGNYIVLNILIKKFQNWYNFNGKYFFVNRSKNNRKLLIVVAGYKNFLWRIVFDRISNFLENDIDVCICAPGVNPLELQKICTKRKWSYLSTKENKLSLAQNLAIKLHPRAKYIYKLDEDIFIGKNYFKNMFNTFLKIKKDNKYNFGVLVPVLNVNGVTYIDFLEFVGKADEYRKIFSELKSSCMGIKCHNDPQAAEYLWDNSFPFDQRVKEFEIANKNRYKIVPHRYSIGAIFFERTFFEMMGGFKVAPEGFMGIEESELCTYCFESSFPMIIACGVFAGHLGFGPQNSKMKEYFIRNIHKFEI